MKILAAGDIHGDSELAKKLAKKAKQEKVDLVILCGDLTFAEMSTKGIIGPFVKEKKKVLLIPGNHESFATADFLAEFYGVKNIHGYSAKYEDIGIFGCGGTDLGLTRMSDKDIFETLKKAHKGIENTKTQIMVTHMHARNTKAEFSGISGSKGIRKAIDILKPDIILSAHIHEAEGIEEKIGKTRLINVGRKGKIINI